MKALTVKQPWAWAIIHAGKCWENRNWKTNYRGPLLIHSGLKFDEQAPDWIEFMGIEKDGIVRRAYTNVIKLGGGIIGRVDLTDCCEVTNALLDCPEDPLGWISSSSKYAWKLENPKPLIFTPCKGKLGLWDYNERIGGING